MYYINRQNIKHIGTEHLDALKTIRNNFAEGLTKGLICFGISCDYCPFTNDNNIHGCNCCLNKDSSVFKESSFNIKSNREDCIREIDKMIEEIKNKRGSDGMFRDAKIGDKVWSFSNGWGKIERTDIKHICKIKVRFENDIVLYFTEGGKLYHFDKNPSLFWDEIKFKTPEKPFDLEEELKQLQVKDFVVKEFNYKLYWNNQTEKIECNYGYWTEVPSAIYFTEDSVKEFMGKIKDKEIAKKEFLDAYKRVFV